MHVAVLNITQCRNAVFGSVNRNICIAADALFHCFQYTAASREQSCPALLLFSFVLLKLYAGTFQPFCKVLKGKYRIDISGIMCRLILFCNARSYEYDLCGRHTPLYIGGMRLHWRKHGRQIFQLSREILLNKQIDRMAARCDQNIGLHLFEDTLVFTLYYGGADGSFLGIGKSQLLKCFSH